MSDKRISVEYVIGGLEISGYGISEKGKEVSLPEEIAESLISEGIAKSKGKFKTFTNASVIEGENVPQPYLGQPLTINIDEILSAYPSEDGIGSSIHSHRGQTWKVLETHNIVEKRLNE